MPDDLVLRALIAGAGVALVSGPLGCFVVWRRMAYFGDAMAHGALLGVALGVASGAGPFVGAVVFALCASALLARLAARRSLGIDAWLGVLAHGSLALGLVAVSLMATRVDLMSLLLGDVLAVSWTDVLVILGFSLCTLGLLALFWRPLLNATIEPDLARAEGTNVAAVDLFLMMAIALTIAIAMKIVGVLLVTALLVVPAAAARFWSRSPETMALFSALVGIASVFGGLEASLFLDSPAGPSIVAVAVLVFFVGLALRPVFRDQPREETRS
ncbi:metal ABC transporter permease [Phaeovibrio sulfidiphilus]|uniref:High-affinity zinc uptake system membrane protein ZnuB n=2 Tax=Phaeovibrio sulfidiphilus TaxID=1220600 RepID=A0A8J6YN04_9PROT|nr:iron chelate uptake ABC transporter family permease subunit [Phaeovibrio sulfidiphilus]MBE1237753.1 metal ABC transporter permease [Phaeovibrio sulfidiphilus]